jgi:hypothetical protein
MIMELHLLPLREYTLNRLEDGLEIETYSPPGEPPGGVVPPPP